MQLYLKTVSEKTRFFMPELLNSLDVTSANKVLMQSVDKFIESFLPPQTYEYRKDGPYLNQIDNLNDLEKIEFEQKLIERIDPLNFDSWIVEALAHLKSQKALNPLYDLLSKTREKAARIIIASSIFQINPDPAMCDLIYNEGTSITEKYSLIALFYYMGKVNDDRVNKFIKQYHNHSDILLSSNAKRWVK